MRKGLSLAGAALLAATTFVSPAFAQGGGNQPGSGGGGQGSGGQGSGGQGSGGQGSGQQGDQQSGQGQGSGQQGAGATQSGQQGGAQTGPAPAASGSVTSSGGAPTGPAMATGSCGMMAGMYGMTDVNSSQVNQFGETVPNLFYRVDYANVPAPTTVGVIIRYNNELETQTAVTPFTAQNTNGSYDGAIRANIDPANQGFANSIDAGRRGRADGPTSGGSKDSGVSGTAGVSAKGGLQNSGTQGGILPGEYVFYVYTGEIKDMPETVKDGPAGPRFFADEKGYLGKFSCGVSTENGSGPG